MDMGFIGLGAMGAGMAANLARAGHTVRVWNRSRGPAEKLAAQGAVAVSNAKDAARVPVLFSMLSDDAAMRAVLIDAGVLAALAPGSIHVNMATVSIALAKELAALHRERGVGYVAAPVFGRPDVAASGHLMIAAAGEEKHVDAVIPLLEKIGQKVWRFGAAPECANAVKLAMNFMIGCAIESMAEAAALAQAYGAATPDFLELATTTAFAAPIYKTYGKLIADRHFSPAGFKLSLALKDLRLVAQAADAALAPMPFANIVRDTLLEAAAQGDGELDLAAMAKVTLRRAGRP
jgi:hypothetical protein